MSASRKEKKLPFAVAPLAAGTMGVLRDEHQSPVKCATVIVHSQRCTLGEWGIYDPSGAWSQDGVSSWRNDHSVKRESAPWASEWWSGGARRAMRRAGAVLRGRGACSAE